MKLSLRLPPTLDAVKAGQLLKNLLEADPPYGAQVTFDLESRQRLEAPPLAQWLERSVEQASSTYFGAPVAYNGEGGSIPFMGMLGEKFPGAQFLITGVLEAFNAHRPNEFLHASRPASALPPASPRCWPITMLPAAKDSPAASPRTPPTATKVMTAAAPTRRDARKGSKPRGAVSHPDRRRRYRSGIREADYASTNSAHLLHGIGFDLADAFGRNAVLVRQFLKRRLVVVVQPAAGVDRASGHPVRTNPASASPSSILPHRRLRRLRTDRR